MCDSDFAPLPVGAVLFPSADVVFAADEQGLASHLLPLLTVRLELVRPDDPAWVGNIHVVTTAEHVCGLVGDDTPHAHGALLRPNWIGFQMDGDRYRLAGDPRFFFLHPDNKDLVPGEGTRADIIAEHEESQAAYRDGHARFVAGEEFNYHDWIEQLGGPVEALGNWVELGDFPMSYEAVGEDEYAYPISPSGNRFHHVVTIPGYSYIDHQPCILLFFEPIERLALITFDW